jgi:hypothetical protein
MGLFQSLSEFVSNRTWDIENFSRKRGQLDLKMELFVAQYGKNVIHPHISIFTNRRGHDNKNEFVTCYVRIDYGHQTEFEWFNDMGNAIDYADELRKSDKHLNVIGPHYLPKGKDERFR